MTHSKIIEAYPVILKLLDIDLPFEASWNLTLLTEEMKTAYDFYRSQQRKLLEKYKPTYMKETDEFKFESPEQCKEFQEKMGELDKLEADIKTSKIRIPIISDLKMKGRDIIAVKDFVEFYHEEPEKTEEPEFVIEEVKEEDIHGND